MSFMLKYKKIHIYFKKSNYPELYELKKIINLIDIFKPDLVLAIGGGSVIDYAKIARIGIDAQNMKKAILHPKNFRKKKL